MFPAFLQTPAAVILLLGGVLACFAGYRTFRIVLGIYGFIIGVLLATSIVGTENTLWTIVAALTGGLLGALILIAAYFIGVALIGAALNFPLMHPAVVSVIPGGQRQGEPAANARLLGAAIPPDLWRELKQEGLMRQDAPTERIGP